MRRIFLLFSFIAMLAFSGSAFGMNNVTADDDTPYIIVDIDDPSHVDVKYGGQFLENLVSGPNRLDLKQYGGLIVTARDGYKIVSAENMTYNESWDRWQVTTNESSHNGMTFTIRTAEDAVSSKSTVTINCKTYADEYKFSIGGESLYLYDGVNEREFDPEKNWVKIWNFNSDKDKVNVLLNDVHQNVLNNQVTFDINSGDKIEISAWSNSSDKNITLNIDNASAVEVLDNAGTAQTIVDGDNTLPVLSKGGYYQIKTKAGFSFVSQEGGVEKNIDDWRINFAGLEAGNIYKVTTEGSAAVENNVTINISDPKGVTWMCTIDGENVNMPTLVNGENLITIAPNTLVVMYPAAGYNVKSVTGMEYLADSYALEIEAGQTYKIEIDVEKNDDKTFIIDIDNPAAVTVKYAGTFPTLQAGENKIDLVEYSGLIVTANDGYRITRADNMGYNENMDRYQLTTYASQHTGIKVVIRTEVYNPSACKVTIDCKTAPEYYTLTIGGSEQWLYDGKNEVEFNPEKNNVYVSSFSNSLKKVDLLLNGVRQNVIEKAISFSINNGDKIEITASTELAEEDNNITLNIADSKAIKVTNRQGDPVEIHDGANVLPCLGKYELYLLKANEGYAICGQEGGINNYDGWRLEFKGLEAGNVYTVFTEIREVEKSHATLHVNDLSRMSVTRIGSHYFDLVEGDNELTWEKGGLNQLYMSFKLAINEKAVVTQNGKVITGEERKDYCYAMLEEGDVIDVKFEEFDLNFDVTINVDGQRDGIKVIADGLATEESNFKIPYNSDIVIMPQKKFEIVSLSVNDVAFAPNADGAYYIEAVNDNYTINVKVQKLYDIVMAHPTAEGSTTAKVYMIDDEGDLSESATVSYGTTIHLHCVTEAGHEFVKYTVNGKEIDGNTFFVEDKHTGEDGHTIVVSATTKALPGGVDSIFMDSSDVEIYDLNGRRVNNIENLSGIYLVKTTDGFKKIIK